MSVFTVQTWLDDGREGEGGRRRRKGMSLSLAWPASWLHLVYAMQRNKKKKRKRSKDSGSWPGYHLSSLGYHHLDIITYEVATTHNFAPPTYGFPPNRLLTAYSVQHQTRPDQTRPVQIKKNIYIKELRKLKKIKKNKKTTAQSIPMWSPTIVLTLPSTV
jgi:hypothetical protein